MKQIRRTKAQWQHLIDSYQHSQLTVNAFCAQQDISPATFYLWRKKLLSRVKPTPLTDQSSPWLVVDMPKEQRQEDRWQMELCLPGGAVLRFGRVD